VRRGRHENYSVSGILRGVRTSVKKIRAYKLRARQRERLRSLAGRCELEMMRQKKAPCGNSARGDDKDEQKLTGS
jgi:hypothetical protein